MDTALDTKIYLVAVMERDEMTGRMERIVSHGIGNNSLRNYVLQNEKVSYYNPKRDDNGMYIDGPGADDD